MWEYFENVWNGPNRYSLIIIGAIIVLYIPFMIVFMGRKKKNAATFLAANPGAAKVFFKVNALTGGQMTILSVNGERPAFFSEGIKQGFYIAPGEGVVEFQYSQTRPGVMYKSVTTTIGPVSARVTAEADKAYEISYDKKAEACVFVEA